MIWKGLRDLWEQNLADAMMEAFQRGYMRVQRLMLPYQLQEKGYPWSPELTAVIKALAAEKVKIEENTTKAKIKEVVMDGIKEGLNPNDIAKNIHEKVGLAMARARNIASTEINFAYSLGHWVGAVEAGVEKVRIVAALDAFVCEHCRALDGKVLDVATLEAGYLPPFHFGCRCHLQPLLGSLARVPKSDRLVPRWSWVSKGFGLPAGNRGMQVVIERILPSLRQMRTEEIKRWIQAIKQLPPPYSLRKETRERIRQEILEASQHMTLTQLRETTKISWFGFSGDPFGRGSMGGGYFPQGIRPCLPKGIGERLGFSLDQPAIGIKYWAPEVIGHEFAHRLCDDVLNWIVKAELELRYNETLEKCLPLIDEIFNNEKIVKALKTYAGEEEMDSIMGAFSLAHRYPEGRRGEYMRYILRALDRYLQSSPEEYMACERILRPLFPSLYGATQGSEFVAEAAGRIAGGYFPPEGAPWVEVGEKLYASMTDIIKVSRALQEQGIKLPKELIFGEDEVIEKMEDMTSGIAECKPLKRFLLLKEGKRIGGVALGRSCLTYQLEAYIPGLRGKIETIRENGLFPYFIDGGQEGFYWDRCASLENINEAIYGLYRLADDFGLELKEVDRI
jgi:SPP1 gp7 family putative phage head morphogenesis protein